MLYEVITPVHGRDVHSTRFAAKRGQLPGGQVPLEILDGPLNPPRRFLAHV